MGRGPSVQPVWEWDGQHFYWTGEPLRLCQIAEVAGLSMERINQIANQAKGKLARAAAARGIYLGRGPIDYKPERR